MESSVRYEHADDGRVCAFELEILFLSIRHAVNSDKLNVQYLAASNNCLDR